MGDREVRPISAADPEPPDSWPAIAEQCKSLGTVGYFASVVVAGGEDAFNSSVPPAPLWRGHPLTVRLRGLERLGQTNWLSWVWRGQKLRVAGTRRPVALLRPSN